MRLLIFPYNGNGLEALDCIEEGTEFLGFIDDTVQKQGINRFGHKIYGREALSRFDDAKILAVPGSPESYKIRRDIISSLGIDEDRFTTLIHSRAKISKLAQIGRNVLIMAGTVITSNAIIQDHVCILPNTVIHHDSVVGAYTLVGANVTIAGNTIIGTNCYIGGGCSIINGISIGNNTLVGLGSNIIKSLPEDVRAIGNPAKIL